MTGDLVALVERVERATGADKALDWDIAEALSLPRPLDASYSISLDAAISLVPEGWTLRQANFSAPCADDRKWHLNLHGGTVGEDTFVGRGASMALALVSACLRARAQESGHG